MGSTSKRGGFLLPAGIAFVGFTTQFGGGLRRERRYISISLITDFGDF